MPQLDRDLSLTIEKEHPVNAANAHDAAPVANTGSGWQMAMLIDGVDSRS